MRKRKVIQVVGPEVIFDLYKSMPVADRHTFIRLLASISTAYEPALLLDSLPKTQWVVFAEQIFKKLNYGLFPVLLKVVFSCVKANPQWSYEEVERYCAERISTTEIEREKGFKEVEAEILKQERERSPDQESVERAIKVLDKSAEGSSIADLAKEHGVTKGYISQIRAKEGYWRAHAERLKRPDV
jgi:hypothetical protein